MKSLKNSIPILFLLLLWFIGSIFVNQLFLPKPVKVIESFIQLIQNGMMQKSIIYSLGRITVSMLLACLISLPLSLLMVSFKNVDYFLNPIVNALRFIPPTVFFPILVMWCGIYEKMKIIFLIIAMTFYLIPTIKLCLKEISNDLIEQSIAMGMNKMQLMLKVLLPYAAPTICESLLTMYGMGWTYVVIAETINAKFGLGYIITLGTARGRTDLVFAAILAIMLIGYLVDLFGNKIIKSKFSWKHVKEV